MRFFHPPHPSKPKKQQKPPEEALTSREQEVLDALTDGLTYKQIAHKLSIGLETVRYHIKNIYSKMHIHSRSEIMAKSARRSR
ncbi:MAG: response regulator transcription factor [Bacteroidia bacterium]|nr:response regulator transcription factor [Bacteroidia bacterium]